MDNSTSEYLTESITMHVLSSTPTFLSTGKVTMQEITTVLTSNIELDYSYSVITIASIWILLGIFGLFSNFLFVLMTSSGSVRTQSYAVYLIAMAIVSMVICIVQITSGVMTLWYWLDGTTN